MAHVTPAYKFVKSQYEYNSPFSGGLINATSSANYTARDPPLNYIGRSASHGSHDEFVPKPLTAGMNGINSSGLKIPEAQLLHTQKYSHSIIKFN